MGKSPAKSRNKPQVESHKKELEQVVFKTNNITINNDSMQKILKKENNESEL